MPLFNNERQGGNDTSQTQEADERTLSTVIISKSLTDASPLALGENKKRINKCEPDICPGSDNKENLSQNVSPSTPVTRKSVVKLSPAQREERERLLDFSKPNFNLILGMPPELYGTKLPSSTLNNRYEKSGKKITVSLERTEEQLNKNSASDSPLKRSFNEHSDFTAEIAEGTPQKNGRSTYMRDVHDREKLGKLTSIETSSFKKIRFYASAPDENQRRYLEGKVHIENEALQNFLQEIAEKSQKITLSGVVPLANLEANLKAAKEKKKLREILSRAPKNGVKETGDVVITRKLLAHWHAASQLPRSPTQEQSFGISAGKYAQGVGLPDHQRQKGKSDFELGHLSAFSFGGIDGEDPQVVENLVVMTEGCNTWMMLAEAVVRYLLLDKKIERVIINVKAELIPGTEIGKKIFYSIKWNVGGCEKFINFKFDALRYDPPPRALQKYIFDVVDYENGSLAKDQKAKLDDITAKMNQAGIVCDVSSLKADNTSNTVDTRKKDQSLSKASWIKKLWADDDKAEAEATTAKVQDANTGFCDAETDKQMSLIFCN